LWLYRNIHAIPHAVEMLAQSTGILLNKFDDSEEFKEAILWLIENKEERVSMGKNAFRSLT
jgi:glycosyltransferase involved in cell wall biosynthesis